MPIPMQGIERDRYGTYVNGAEFLLLQITDPCAVYHIFWQFSSIRYID